MDIYDPRGIFMYNHCFIEKTSGIFMIDWPPEEEKVIKLNQRVPTIFHTLSNSSKFGTFDSFLQNIKTHCFSKVNRFLKVTIQGV